MIDPRPQMIGNARQRATRAGVPFSITVDDITIPTHCPVLGIPLARRMGRQGGCDSSPSLDRLVPELGYTPDNIIVLSKRANRLKNDATLDEVERIADWLARHVAPAPGPRKRKNPA